MASAALPSYVIMRHIKCTWSPHDNSVASLAVLCREEAQNLWSKKADFDKLGVRLVAVVKEWIQTEIDDFSAKFWHNEELYLDEDKVRTTVSNSECRCGHVDTASRSY